MYVLGHHFVARRLRASLTVLCPPPSVSCSNFRQISDIFTMFLPQMLFLLCLFGWLCILCLLKWSMYSASFDGRYGSHCAPSLLLIFINMFLLKDMEGEVEDEDKGVCYGYLFDGQKELQYGLLALGVICIPWMLLVKPILIQRRRKSAAAAAAHLPHTAAEPHSSGEGEHEEEEEEMSEIWIHQAIHTVEYVLGSISHTASYLRLWALSLAHSRE